MSTARAIRQGMIVVPNVSDYNYLGSLGNLSGAGRKRLGKRRKTRVRSFSGAFRPYALIDYDEGLSGVGAYWSQYTAWWSQQNRVMQIAVPGLFLLGSVKLVQALSKKAKGKK